jgi:hypothetical protein
VKYQTILKWCIPLIGVLAFIAAGIGLFDTVAGESYAYTNHRGETVQINGHGLYYYDSLSSAAQMQANDLISLILGLPLLGLSSYWAFRGSLKGQFLLTGTLGFYLYTYLSMSMLAAYNDLFLIYVGLFALSLYAFIVAMLSFDLEELPQHFSHRFPHRAIAVLLFFVAGFLALAWIGRILSEMQVAQVALLENTTTRVIQALDLALIVPPALLAGTFLLRRQALGYLLASVLIMKFITMGLAVSAMGINMVLVGVSDSLAILVPFLLITVLNLLGAWTLFNNISTQQDFVPMAGG